MILDLFLIEHPQVQNAPPPIGCLKVLLNCHWLLLLELKKMFCLNLGSLIGFYSFVQKRLLLHLDVVTFAGYLLQQWL